jgi:hypothetical protein
MIHKVVNGRITEVWRSSFRGAQNFTGGQEDNWQTSWDVPEAQTAPDADGWQQKAFAKGYANGWLHQYKAGGKGAEQASGTAEASGTAQASGSQGEGKGKGEGEEKGKGKGNGGQPSADGLATERLTEAVANLSAAMLSANGQATNLAAAMPMDDEAAAA